MQSAAGHPARSDPTEIAVAVVEHADRFLIGRRPEDTVLAGLWEFPGGKVQPGETPAVAAARECLEETGLAVEVGELYVENVCRYEHGRVRLHFFACTPLEPDRPPRSPFRWVARQQLSKFEFPRGNRPLTERLTRARDGL